jgi:hypothetical protein
MISLSRIADSFRKFLAPGVACAMFAACTFPVSAQGYSPIRHAPFSVEARFSERLPTSTGEGGVPAGAVALFTISAMGQHKIEMPVVSRDPSDFMRGWEKMVEFSGTPFTQQVRLPLASLFGGRILLDGFNAVTPMEHIQRGLPGGGSLDAWSPVPMGHAGVILPKQDNQYGFSLSFHLGGEGKSSHVAEWNGLAARLAMIIPW